MFQSLKMQRFLSKDETKFPETKTKSRNRKEISAKTPSL